MYSIPFFRKHTPSCTLVRESGQAAASEKLSRDHTYCFPAVCHDKLQELEGRCASLTKDLAQALEELNHYKKTKPRMSVKHIKDDEDKVH